MINRTKLFLLNLFLASKPLLLTLFLFSVVEIQALEGPTGKIDINNQMLEGKTLKIIEYGEDLDIIFVPSCNSSDKGKVRFHFNGEDKSSDEILDYRIENGQIIYYEFDRTKHKMELISKSPDHWTILHYEDIDGNNPKFGFGKPDKKFYTIIDQNKKPDQRYHSIKTYDSFDQLYMDIYGRTDTTVSSRRDQLEEIENFLSQSSDYLIQYYKINMKLLMFKNNQNKRSEITKQKEELDFIKNLYGRTIRDYDKHKINTIVKLKNSFHEALKNSVEFQKYNYNDMEHMDEQVKSLRSYLDDKGTPEQKNDFKVAERIRLLGSYKWLKSKLDNKSIWCTYEISSKKIPIFYPRSALLTELYEAYWDELSRTGKAYNANDIFSRAKELETKSIRCKSNLQNKYLNPVQTKIKLLKGSY